MAQLNITTHASHGLIFFAVAVFISLGLSVIVFRRCDSALLGFTAANIFAAVITAAGALHYKFLLSMHAVSAIFIAVAAVVLFVMFKLGKDGLPKRVLPLSVSAALTSIIALCAALRVLLMWSTSYPLGNDTYFHCLYAKSIMNAGRLIFTMAPSDPMPLRYPWGMHVALAFSSEISGVPIHTIFKFALIFWSCATAAGIFAHARQLTGKDGPALWAAAMYGLTANFGSIDYIRWGGLGNVLAMSALISLVATTQLSTVRKPGALVLQALLVAASFLIHGSAALVPIVIFVCISAALAASGAEAWKDTALSAFTCAAALAVSAAAAPDIFTHLAGISSTASLATERYVSILDFPLMLGVIFSAAAAAGFVLLSKQHSPGGVAVFTWSALLMAGFLASRYVYPLYMYLKTGEPSTAYLPSRFATDLVYPAAIFAGAGACAAWRALRTTRDRIITIFSRAAFAAILLSVPAQHVVDKWGQAYAGPAETAAMRKLKESAPPGSLILNRESARGAYWVPYETGLASSAVSRPMLHHLAYESGADAIKVIESRSALANILFERRDVELTRRVIGAYPAPVFAYTDEPLPLPHESEVSRTGGIYVYRLK